MDIPPFIKQYVRSTQIDRTAQQTNRHSQTFKPNIMKAKRIEFRQGDALFVFTLNTTRNKKIAGKGEKIFQTYSYSRQQFNLANIGHKITMDSFFKADQAVCFDCPFSQNRGCYTAKANQYAGFLSSLRSIGKASKWDDIPEYSDSIAQRIVSMAKDRYVRLGTYGEPSLIPILLIAEICGQAKSWTGYTHQYMRKPEYAPFLMASLHSDRQMTYAEKLGYRAFIASKEKLGKPFVNCPASKEAGFKSTCSACGLCSGTLGKGNKSVWILEH